MSPGNGASKDVASVLCSCLFPFQFCFCIFQQLLCDLAGGEGVLFQGGEFFLSYLVDQGIAGRFSASLLVDLPYVTGKAEVESVIDIPSHRGTGLLAE